VCRTRALRIAAIVDRFLQSSDAVARREVLAQ
jgi:hypothetical protein